jgi:hypothetical protein
MRTILGSVIGALLVGVLLIASGRTGSTAAGQAQVATSPYAAQTRLVANPGQPAPALADVNAAGPVLVKCEPGQQALVRDARDASGAAVRQIECVAAAPSSAVYIDQYGRALAVSDARIAGDVYDQPRAVRTVAYEPAPAPRRVTYQRAPERAPVRRTSGRSWKKTALVIGGSAGTGAGIGAIAGGKKGALIGAAIGGGAASLFEAVKR